MEATATLSKVTPGTVTVVATLKNKTKSQPIVFGSDLHYGVAVMDDQGNAYPAAVAKATPAEEAMRSLRKNHTVPAPGRPWPGFETNENIQQNSEGK